MRNPFTNRIIRGFGEIALIVVGILLALLLDDWNERRKAAEAFEQAVERAYTDVKKERYYINADYLEFDLQLHLLEALLDAPDTVSDRDLPYVLYYLDLPQAAGGYVLTAQAVAVRQQAQLLAGTAESPEQLRVAKHLLDFGAATVSYQDMDRYMFTSGEHREQVAPLLREAGLRDPAVTWKLSSHNGFASAQNDTFRPYTEAEQATARALLTDPRMTTALESLAARKQRYLTLRATDMQAADSVLARVKATYPDLRLLFEDVGIIGSAVDPSDMYWERSTPMRRVPGHEARWTVDIELLQGLAKFRTRNSWDENWGGTTFPGDQLKWFGDDLEVPAGRWRVTVDLLEETYLFELLNDVATQHGAGE